jgi:hypothetical protein
MGIAIEKGFHSLVEVLLQNGVPADGSALLEAAEYRNKDLVELLFQMEPRWIMLILVTLSILATLILVRRSATVVIFALR